VKKSQGMRGRGRSNPSFFEGLENRLLFAFGDADTNFGTAGRATVGFSSSGRTPAIQRMLVTSGGKILAGGTTGLARFTSAGALDTTFGTSGKITLSSAATFIAEAVDPATNNIYVLVTATSGTGLFRYSANGKLDSTYGSGGTVTVTTSKTFTPQSMVVQSDGKGAIAGVFKTSRGSGRKVRVYRLKSDGTGDSGFNSSGSLEFNFGQSSFLADTVFDRVAAVKIVGGGKIDVIGGTIDYTPAGTDPDTGEFHDAVYDKATFAVARLALAADLQLDRPLAAAQRLADREFELGLGVGAALASGAARPPAGLAGLAGLAALAVAAPALEQIAEHLREEVGEAAAAPAAAAEHARELLRADGAEAAAGRRLEVLAVAPMLAELVVALALLGVAEHVVGLGNALEPGLDLGALVRRMAVGMPLLRQLAIGALDLVLGSAAAHAERVVVVLEFHGFL